MSKGIYTILDSYSGEHEKFLTAMNLLRERLRTIENNNKKSGFTETRPQYTDILATHNFSTITTFRPHVTVGYEYFKKSKEGGTGSVNLYINGNTSVRFNLQGNEGHWINDMVIRVVFQDIGVKNVNIDNPPALRYRYCDLPGMRLFEKVSLNMDEINIAEYTSDDVAFYDFHVSASKKYGYLRSMGREDTNKGEFYLSDQQVKQVLEYRNGAQTYKYYQPKLELWIPLLFWFNKDVRQSLRNMVIKT